MLCPFLIKIDDKKSNFVECQGEDCLFFNTDYEFCSLLNLTNVAEDLKNLSERTQKSLISTLNKNTDELIFHQNETSRQLHQLLEGSAESYVKLNQEFARSIQENTKKLQNLGSTMYGILSDQKDGRKIVLNQLGEVVRKIEESIQTIQQTASDSRTSIKQFQEAFLSAVEGQQTENREILDTLNQLIKKNDDILSKIGENSQDTNKNIKNLIELMNSGLSQQYDMVQSVQENLGKVLENTTQTREMIDRRLGEYLAAQRSFMATQVERSNEEVRLMSEVYKNNRKMLDFMLEEKELEERQKEKQRLQEAEVHNERGVEYFHKAAYEAALVEFGKALEINPNLFSIKNNVALVLQKMGKTEEAIQKFTENMNVNPEMVESYINLGFCYYSQRNYKKAVEMFERATGIDETKSQIFEGLGHAYYELDKPQKAIEAWKRALEIDPSLQSPKIKLEIFHV